MALAAGVRILSREGVRKLDPSGTGSEIAFVESEHARDLPLQRVDSCGRQERNPVFVALASAHDDLARRELDVLYPQPRALEESESGAVQKKCHQLRGAAQVLEHGADFPA